MHRRLALLASLALLLCSQAQQAQKPSTTSLAATPPMGWNSWNWFAGKVTDRDIRQAADLLVSSGMRDAGYVYVNIDDTWEGERDAQGVLHSNSKFPDMKALADYVHSKGLKLGIYSSPGSQTCARFEGSYGHEQQDADLYASWGIDFLKYDLCSFHRQMDEVAPGNTYADKLKQNALMRDAYAKMHQAILNTGRPMIYSLCQYGHDSGWQWAAEVGGNMWRTTGDINPSFDRISLIGREQAGLAKYAGPGHWNDPDMLEVGNGKLTSDENRTHMGMWAMLAAPLLAGNNLSQLTPEITSILVNRGVLAIDQDPLGKEADRVFAEGPIEVWSRPLADGGRAIAIFNFGEDESFLRGIDDGIRKILGRAGNITDVWTGKPLDMNAKEAFVLKRHASLLLRQSAVH